MKLAFNITPEGTEATLDLSYGFTMILRRVKGVWWPTDLRLAHEEFVVQSVGTGEVGGEVGEIIERAFQLEAGRLSAREAQIVRLELEEWGDAEQLRNEQVIVVYTCPSCGKGIRDQTVKNRADPPRCFECNGIDPQHQSLMDGVAMIPTHLPVRKLPDAFLKIDSAMPLGVNSRYLSKLGRQLNDNPGFATVRLTEVGGFVDNALTVLRYVVGTVGFDWHAGRVEIPEDAGLVRWHRDAEEGVGAG